MKERKINLIQEKEIKPIIGHISKKYIDKTEKRRPGSNKIRIKSDYIFEIVTSSKDKSIYRNVHKSIWKQFSEGDEIKLYKIKNNLYAPSIHQMPNKNTKWLILLTGAIQLFIVVMLVSFFWKINVEQ